MAYKIPVAILFSLISGSAYAGAWVQDAGKGLLIQNASYYSASKYFDNYGHKQSQATYRKYELNPYLEYGLNDSLTVGANIFLSRVSQNSTLGTGNRSNIGIGDSEIFARSLIWKRDGLVFSAEPLVKLPSMEHSDEHPKIGNTNFDAGMGFSGGYSFSLLGLNNFIDLDIGYRHRFGTPHDQMKYAATVGVSPTKNIVLSGQVFNTTRLVSPRSPAFTESSGDDYDLTKLQLSATYKTSDTLSFGVAGFSDVSGKNTGRGSGTILTVNKEF